MADASNRGDIVLKMLIQRLHSALGLVSVVIQTSYCGKGSQGLLPPCSLAGGQQDLGRTNGGDGLQQQVLGGQLLQ